MLFSVINYFALHSLIKHTACYLSFKKSVNSSEKGVNHQQDKIFAALLTNITHISTLQKGQARILQKKASSSSSFFLLGQHCTVYI